MASPILIVIAAAGVLALAAGAASADEGDSLPSGGDTGPQPGTNPKTWGPVYNSLTPAEKAKVLQSRGMSVSDDPALAKLLKSQQVEEVLPEKATVVSPSGKKTQVSVVKSPSAQTATVKETSPPPMPKVLQEAMANALKMLTVQSDGSIKGPVTADAVRAATQIAGRLDSSGYPDAAESLRGFASRAAKLVPPPKPAETLPMPPQMDAAMRAKVQNMIQNERDPAKLRKLVSALKQYPKSGERDMAISSLKALILQIEQANIAQESLEKAQAVMEQPTGSLEAPPPAPAPVVVSPPPPPPPSPVVVPPPAPEPAPKSPVQQAAEGMALHLKKLQSAYGMPGAKGKEDKSIVIRFQKLAGITQDGKAGPGTLGKAASLGQGDLPLVMYWPSGSNRYSVQKYRDTLRRLADQAASQGFNPLANQLRMVANYESGQGGIAQYGPALT